MPHRRLTDLQTFDDFLDAEMSDDPTFREEWQRYALAREVAVALIRYRSAHGLSQRGLARLLGVSQPRVSELESGEKNPQIETLIALSRATGLEFAIGIGPSSRPRRTLVKSVRESHRSYTYDDVSIIVATG